MAVWFFAGAGGCAGRLIEVLAEGFGVNNERIVLLPTMLVPLSFSAAIALFAYGLSALTWQLRDPLGNSRHYSLLAEHRGQLFFGMERLVNKVSKSLPVCRAF